MTRYFMTPVTYNRFKTMGYDLMCRLCDGPIKPFDEVETKASGNNDEVVGPKFYHAECYDAAHMDIEYDEEYLRAVLEEEGIEELKLLFWEFDMGAPDIDDPNEIIDILLELEMKWAIKNRNT